MADLSSIFAPPRTARRSNVFDLQNEYAAQFKRKIVMREAMQQDLSPEDGDDFFNFVGNRLAQLGDAQGAFAVQEQQQALRAQQAKSERANFELSLKLEDEKRKRTKAEREATEFEQEQADRLAELGQTQNLETINGKQVMVTRGADGELVDVKGLGGVSVTNNNTSTSSAVPPGFEPTKTEVSRLQDTAVKTGNQLLRLTRIKANLDTDFLTVPGKVADIWRRGKDAFGASSEEDKEKIRTASRQRQAAANSLNQMIRDMSGVAVSVQEAKRLKANEPDPGEKNKPWTGDSPTDFMAKLEQKQEMLEDTIARYNYILRNMNVFGYSTVEEIEKDLIAGKTGVSLEEMKDIYKQRIVEMSEQGIPPEEIRIRMEEEFGVPFDD